jgi:hypothetical protein
MAASAQNEPLWLYVRRHLVANEFVTLMVSCEVRCSVCCKFRRVLMETSVGARLLLEQSFNVYAILSIFIGRL